MNKPDGTLVPPVDARPLQTVNGDTTAVVDHRTGRRTMIAFRTVRRGCNGLGALSDTLQIEDWVSPRYGRRAAGNPPSSLAAPGGTATSAAASRQPSWIDALLSAITLPRLPAAGRIESPARRPRSLVRSDPRSLGERRSAIDRSNASRLAHVLRDARSGRRSERAPGPASTRRSGRRSARAGGDHGLDHGRALHVAELTPVEVAVDVHALGPAEEDVAGRLHHPLSLHHPLAGLPVAALRQVLLQHRRGRLLDLQEQRVLSRPVPAAGR